MSFSKELHELKEYRPLGEKEEVIDKITSIVKPRDFEKLKLTDNECKEILETTDELITVERQLSHVPGHFREAKPKPAKNLSYI